MPPFIDRMTPLRAISGGLIFKSIAVGLAALLVDYWNASAIMAGLIISFEFSKLWLAITSASLFMGLCASRVAASQFAIYMALSNLAISTGAGLTGPLDKWLEFHQLFFIIALFILAVMGCLKFFDLDKHKAGLKITFTSIGNGSESDRS